MDKKWYFKPFVISVLISLGTGYLSSLLSTDMRGIYNNINKPFFAPPGSLFAPVWIILYLLMAIAAYRIYSEDPERQDIKDALFYYGAQLIFNFMWSILFFRFVLPGVAFLDLAILLLFVIITTVKFWRIDKAAGVLMIPYVIWLIYAALLNYSILRLNS